MGSVEESSVVRGEPSPLHLEAKIDIPAVGQGGDETSLGPKQRPQIEQEFKWVAEVFKDIRTQDEGKRGGQRGKASVQVCFDEFQTLGELVSLTNRLVDPHDFEPSRCKHVGQVPAGTSHVQHPEPASLSRETPQQKSMAAVTFRFEGIVQVGDLSLTACAREARIPDSFRSYSREQVDRLQADAHFQQ
jgi:hypothetical protein